MKTTTPDLSVLLINWNALEVTSGALAAIRQQTRGIDYEVIVVDNGSTRDGSPQELPGRFPWIRLIANTENRGFGQPTNQAARLSSGRYLLALNNDTVVLGNVLGESVGYMDAHREVGALGVLHLNDDRTVQPSCFSFPAPLGELAVAVGVAARGASSAVFSRRSLQGRPAHHLPAAGPSAPWRRLIPGRGHWGRATGNVEGARDVDWIAGSFLLVRRECWQQVGELDERFFAYDEDIDWCRRAWQAGWPVRFWPDAAIVHAGSGAKPFMTDKTFVHFRSRLSYLRKHHAFAIVGLYYLGMTVLLASATVKQWLRYVHGSGTARELRARFLRLTRFLTLRPGRAGG